MILYFCPVSLFPKLKNFAQTENRQQCLLLLVQCPRFCKNEERHKSKKHGKAATDHARFDLNRRRVRKSVLLLDLLLSRKMLTYTNTATKTQIQYSNTRNTQYAVNFVRFGLNTEQAGKEECLLLVVRVDECPVASASFHPWKTTVWGKMRIFNIF